MYYLSYQNVRTESGLDCSKNFSLDRSANSSALQVQAAPTESITAAMISPAAKWRCLNRKLRYNTYWSGVSVDYLTRKLSVIREILLRVAWCCR